MHGASGHIAMGAGRRIPGRSVERLPDDPVEPAGRVGPMTRLRSASSADRTDDRFCERCGNQADPATTLSRVGLTTRRACGLHACQRCWARSVGWRPACGVSMVAMPLQRSLPTEQRRDGVAGVLPVAAAASTLGGRKRPNRRSRLPAFAAAGAAFVVAATAFAFVSGVTLLPTGGVAGVTGTPGAAGLGSARVRRSDSLLDRAEPVRHRCDGNRFGRDAPARTDRRAEATGRDSGTRPGGIRNGPTPTRAPTAAPRTDPTPRPTPRAHPPADATLHAGSHAVHRDGAEPRGPAPERGGPDLECRRLHRDRHCVERARELPDREPGSDAGIQLPVRRRRHDRTVTDRAFLRPARRAGSAPR